MANLPPVGDIVEIHCILGFRLFIILFNFLSDTILFSIADASTLFVFVPTYVIRVYAILGRTSAP